MAFFFLIVFCAISNVRNVASQLIIDVKPPVVNGSMYPHRNLTITCAIQSDAVLHDIFNMQLLRKTRADERLIPIAELPLVSHPSPRFVPNAPADIVERSSLSGKCDTNILTNNFMKLEIDIALVKCADAGIYSCSLAYQARSLHSKLISTSSNLTVFLPGTSTTATSSTLLILITVILAVFCSFTT